MARITYLEILENLQKYWTEKELQNFHRLTEKNLIQIATGEIIHSLIYPEIRKVIIYPNISLFYKIDEKENCIYLITFFNNRMNPELIKKLLNF
tara:strand:+ start:236 stop:517 length:282 start_codon:yes stop_codon:yes gene_type:complete